MKTQRRRKTIQQTGLTVRINYLKYFILMPTARIFTSVQPRLFVKLTVTKYKNVRINTLCHSSICFILQHQI